MKKILNGLLILSLSGLSFSNTPPQGIYDSTTGKYETPYNTGSYTLESDGSVQISSEVNQKMKDDINKAKEEAKDYYNNLTPDEQAEQKKESIELRKDVGWKKTGDTEVTRSAGGVTKTITKTSDGGIFKNSSGTNIKVSNGKISGTISKKDIHYNQYNQRIRPGKVP